MHEKQHHDPYMDLSKEQIKQAFEPNDLQKKHRRVKKQAVQPLKNIDTFPVSAAKPVSLSTTDAVPLKDVFHMIARQSGISISISQDVSGGVFYHAENRAAKDVIKDLCDASGLRYKIDNGLIKIEKDSHHLVTYFVQYLAVNRKNESKISVATDVFTTIDQKNTHLDNGSNTLVTSKYENDFWHELQNNIESIIKEDAGSYTIHRQAGLLSINCRDACHKRIEKYLSILDQAITAQVLIDAKIIEVQLKEEFKSGINWNSFKGDFVVQSPLGEIAKPGALDRSAAPARDVFSIGAAGRHLTGLVSFLKTFGTVRTLSNPRLMVANGQSAVLKVATNEVFFRIDYSREYGFETRRDRENVSSEIHTVPIGLVMMVHPAININNDKIVMTLRPTISRIVDQKEDPAVAIVSQQQQKSLIPQVQVREYDSVVCLDSGVPIIYAGLMVDEGVSNESGVPDVSDIPFLGSLFFKGNSAGQKKTELVIWLKAEIVKNLSTNLDEHDMQIYNTFIKDPRPIS